MAKLLTGSIDLNKIDKTKIKTVDKNGNPFKNGAKYLEIAIWVNDTPDQYGNIASIQIGGKEDKIYIGNLKEYQRDNPANKPQAETQSAIAPSDNLPF